MDTLTEQLPPLTAFILPGGSGTAASLHLARCISRRAERTVAALVEAEEDCVRDEIPRFLNRLSDWLFVAARTANASENVPDITWKKSGN